MALETNDAIATKIVQEIVEDISDRRGLDQMWDDVDIRTKREIEAEWRRIVIAALNQQIGRA